MIHLLYMVMGILVGILIKYEIDMRTRKKRVKNRVNYLMATANDSKMQEYDSMLESLRSINESLSTMEKNKREVQ
jgi:hypothetical protein